MDKLLRELEKLTDQFQIVLLLCADVAAGHALGTIKPDNEVQRTHELIQHHLFQDSETWSGTAEDLCRVVLAAPELSDADRELFTFSNWAGRRLTDLSKLYPDAYRSKRASRGNIWLLRRCSR